MEFERPTDRTAELAGKPGVVRFLDLPERRFVMIDGDGPAGELTPAPATPGSPCPPAQRPSPVPLGAGYPCRRARALRPALAPAGASASGTGASVSSRRASQE